MTKTYGWLSPEKLKAINCRPDVLSVLYDLGLLPEQISARVREYVEEAVKEERERCAKIADSLRDKTYWDDPVAGIAATIRKSPMMQSEKRT